MAQTIVDREQHYRLTSQQEQELPGRIKALLGGHVGEQNVIPAREIAVQLKIHDPEGRKTRAAIAILRSLDEPICANERGFWWCANLQEAVTYMEDMDHRIAEDRQVQMNFRRAVKRYFDFDPEQPKLL